MQPKTTILFVCQAANLYGSERTLLAILQHLPTGIAPLVATAESGPLHAELSRLRVPRIDIAFNRTAFATDPLWHFGFFRAFRRILKRHRPTAVVVVYEGNVPLLVAACRSARIPVFRILQRPCIRPPCPIGDFGFMADRIAFQMCDGVFCGSPILRQQLRENCVLFGRPATTISRLPVRTANPICLPAETVRTSWGIPPAAMVVGQFSRLHPIKGIDRLIDAAQKILEKQSNVWFVVGGDHDNSRESQGYKKELEAKARSMGIIDQFRFTGFVDDIFSAINACDVIAMPSLSEGVGISCLEAMLMGRPVVASDVDGLGEIIASSGGGIAIDTAKPGLLADKLIQLLSEKKRRFELGQKGRDWVLSNCTPALFNQAFWTGLNTFLDHRLQIPY